MIEAAKELKWEFGGLVKPYVIFSICTETLSRLSVDVFRTAKNMEARGEFGESLPTLEERVQEWPVKYESRFNTARLEQDQERQTRTAASDAGAAKMVLPTFLRSGFPPKVAKEESKKEKGAGAGSGAGDESRVLRDTKRKLDVAQNRIKNLESEGAGSGKKIESERKKVRREQPYEDRGVRMS